MERLLEAKMQLHDVCPKCSATKGKPCVTRSGKKANNTHAVRIIPRVLKSTPSAVVIQRLKKKAKGRKIIIKAGY